MDNARRRTTRAAVAIAAGASRPATEGLVARDLEAAITSLAQISRSISSNQLTLYVPALQQHWDAAAWAFEAKYNNNNPYTSKDTSKKPPSSSSSSSISSPCDPSFPEFMLDRLGWDLIRPPLSALYQQSIEQQCTYRQELLKLSLKLNLRQETDLCLWFGTAIFKNHAFLKSISKWAHGKVLGRPGRQNRGWNRNRDFRSTHETDPNRIHTHKARAEEEGEGEEGDEEEEEEEEDGKKTKKHYQNEVEDDIQSQSISRLSWDTEGEARENSSDSTEDARFSLSEHYQSILQTRQERVFRKSRRAPAGSDRTALAAAAGRLCFAVTPTSLHGNPDLAPFVSSDIARAYSLTYDQSKTLDVGAQQDLEEEAEERPRHATEQDQDANSEIGVEFGRRQRPSQSFDKIDLESLLAPSTTTSEYGDVSENPQDLLLPAAYGKDGDDNDGVDDDRGGGGDSERDLSTKNKKKRRRKTGLDYRKYSSKHSPKKQRTAVSSPVASEPASGASSPPFSAAPSSEAREHSDRRSRGLGSPRIGDATLTLDGHAYDVGGYLQAVDDGVETRRENARQLEQGPIQELAKKAVGKEDASNQNTVHVQPHGSKMIPINGDSSASLLTGINLGQASPLLQSTASDAVRILGGDAKDAAADSNNGGFEMIEDSLVDKGGPTTDGHSPHYNNAQEQQQQSFQDIPSQPVVLVDSDLDDDGSTHPGDGEDAVEWPTYICKDDIERLVDPAQELNDAIIDTALELLVTHAKGFRFVNGTSPGQYQERDTNILSRVTRNGHHALLHFQTTSKTVVLYDSMPTLNLKDIFYDVARSWIRRNTDDMPVDSDDHY